MGSKAEALFCQMTINRCEHYTPHQFSAVCRFFFHILKLQHIETDVCVSGLSVFTHTHLQVPVYVSRRAADFLTQRFRCVNILTSF